MAVQSGSVQFKQTPLGGNSVWLNGSSGTLLYARSEFEGSSRSVSQGEVIGYVGATGNANSTATALGGSPWRRGGGQRPYPTPAAPAANAAGCWIITLTPAAPISIHKVTSGGWPRHRLGTTVGFWWRSRRVVR